MAILYTCHETDQAVLRERIRLGDTITRCHLCGGEVTATEPEDFSHITKKTIWIALCDCGNMTCWGPEKIHRIETKEKTKSKALPARKEGAIVIQFPAKKEMLCLPK